MTDYYSNCYHCGEKYRWTGSRSYYTIHTDSDFCPKCHGKYHLPFYLIWKRRIKNYFWLNFTRLGRGWKDVCQRMIPVNASQRILKQEYTLSKSKPMKNVIGKLMFVKPYYDNNKQWKNTKEKNEIKRI
jgi:hypothetical protein